jgi:hypothetical protein
MSEIYNNLLELTRFAGKKGGNYESKFNKAYSGIVSSLSTLKSDEIKSLKQEYNSAFSYYVTNTGNKQSKTRENIENTLFTFNTLVNNSDNANLFTELNSVMSSQRLYSDKFKVAHELLKYKKLSTEQAKFVSSYLGNVHQTYKERTKSKQATKDSVNENYNSVKELLDSYNSQNNQTPTVIKDEGQNYDGKVGETPTLFEQQNDNKNQGLEEIVGSASPNLSNSSQNGVTLYSIAGGIPIGKQLKNFGNLVYHNTGLKDIVDYLSPKYQSLKNKLKSNKKPEQKPLEKEKKGKDLGDIVLDKETLNFSDEAVDPKKLEELKSRSYWSRIKNFFSFSETENKENKKIINNDDKYKSVIVIDGKKIEIGANGLGSGNIAPESPKPLDPIDELPEPKNTGLLCRLKEWYNNKKESKTQDSNTRNFSLNPLTYIKNGFSYISDKIENSKIKNEEAYKFKKENVKQDEKGNFLYKGMKVAGLGVACVALAFALSSGKVDKTEVTDTTTKTQTEQVYEKDSTKNQITGPVVNDNIENKVDTENKLEKTDKEEDDKSETVVEIQTKKLYERTDLESTKGLEGIIKPSKVYWTQPEQIKDGSENLEYFKNSWYGLRLETTANTFKSNLSRDLLPNENLYLVGQMKKGGFEILNADQEYNKSDYVAVGSAMILGEADTGYMLMLRNSVELHPKPVVEKETKKLVVDEKPVEQTIDAQPIEPEVVLEQENDEVRNKAIDLFSQDANVRIQGTPNIQEKTPENNR